MTNGESKHDKIGMEIEVNRRQIDDTMRCRCGVLRRKQKKKVVLRLGSPAGLYVCMLCFLILDPILCRFVSLYRVLYSSAKGEW